MAPALRPGIIRKAARKYAIHLYHANEPHDHRNKRVTDVTSGPPSVLRSGTTSSAMYEKPVEEYQDQPGLNI